jgi:hypothetical protein
MSREEILSEIKLLEGNIHTKKWIIKHPSYPPTYTELCVAEDMIMEMENMIKELKKQLLYIND